MGVYHNLRQKILNNHIYLIKKFLIEEEKKLASHSKVLDAGAGPCPYKYIFDKRHEYISQDLGVGVKGMNYSHINIISPIDKIPLKSETFDCILCTQVFEHIPDPQAAMNELARLLKKNGKILMSVPQCVGEHQTPYDFFRYSRYGLKFLAENAGLKISSIQVEGGIFTFLTQEIQSEIPYILFRRKGKDLNKIIKGVCYPFRLLIASLGLLLDKLDQEKKTTAGYLVVFKKV